MLICIWDKLTVSPPAGSHVCHPSRLKLTCLSQLSWAKKSSIKFKFCQANQRGATKVMQDSFTYGWVNVDILPLMHQHLQHVYSKHVRLICTYGIQNFESIEQLSNSFCSNNLFNCAFSFLFFFAQTISLDVNVVLPGL